MECGGAIMARIGFNKLNYLMANLLSFTVCYGTPPYLLIIFIKNDAKAGILDTRQPLGFEIQDNSLPP